MQAFLQNEPYVRKMHTIQKSNENYNNIKILKHIPERIIAAKKNIRVKNVSYSYTNDVNVLRDVDLEIKAGEHTAVVGLSGVGKTTLLDLIVGLLKPTKGEITYDDQTLNQSELEHLRNRVSYVPQGGVLFTGTVLENIMFGTDNLDNKRLKKSLEIANVYEFLDTMPKGLDTQVGEGGFTLSGGQRQRLILARALYRSPEIIILDEATSELDSVTQNTFIKALNQLKGYTTILTVAHRLSNVQDANVVYVIRDGTVVESGNIDELILLNGYFVKMYNSELGLKGK
jgi:ABC-type bacteriocin/lantibiotic exporter with double-glycine peptidase domain